MPRRIAGIVKIASPRVSQEIQRVELNQGAAQCNHIGVRVDLRAIDLAIQDHQIVGVARQISGAERN
jgi:hypothetical protein